MADLVVPGFGVDGVHGVGVHGDRAPVFTSRRITATSLRVHDAHEGGRHKRTRRTWRVPVGVDLVISSSGSRRVVVERAPVVVHGRRGSSPCRIWCTFVGGSRHGELAVGKWLSGFTTGTYSGIRHRGTWHGGIGNGQQQHGTAAGVGETHGDEEHDGNGNGAGKGTGFPCGHYVEHMVSRGHRAEKSQQQHGARARPGRGRGRACLGRETEGRPGGEEEEAWPR